MADFFATRPANIARYFTFEIYHPAVGSLRYIQNVKDKDLRIEVNGEHNAGELVTFNAASVEYSLGDQNSESGKRQASIQLGRVGTDTKKHLRAINRYNSSNPNIDTTDIFIRFYQDGDEYPVNVIKLYVTTVNLEDDLVSIDASDEDIAYKDVSLIYTATKFPGMKVIE